MSAAHPALTVPPPGPSRGRRRARALGALLLLALLALLLLLPAPARAEPPRSVDVTDTTDSVDAAALTQELSRLDFRTEVDLVVLVLDVTDHGLSAAQDTALNDAVLAHARDQQPELLSPDGRFFADGAVILALDPEGRFLGTYAGEDVKLEDSGFEAVQDAMREDAQEGEWEAALLAGAEEYAGLLLRPWWLHPGIIAGAVVALGAVVTAAASLIGLRRAARRRMDEALPRHRDVLARRARTDAAARSLPSDSPYARAVLEEHESYRQRSAEAEQLVAQLPAPSQRPWGWGLRSRHRALAREVEAAVGYLDATDDDIIAAADLLHRRGDWGAAWQRELQPLQDALGDLEEVLAEAETDSAEAAEAVTRLRALHPVLTDELADLSAQFEGAAITPDAALARLDELTAELSAAIAALQESQVGALAADPDEEEVLREVEVDPEDQEGAGYRSLRRRRHDLEVARGSRAIDPAWQLNPVQWYSLWSLASHSELESHRDPGTGSGSTAGFSGSSGFSGAGSSSRF